MADDLAELQKEVAHLRHELDRLKAQHAQAAIYLKDEQGRTRGTFQVDEEGAHVEIWNKEQQVVISIGESIDGAGEIYVAGADGKPRAGLKVMQAGGVVAAQSPEGRINALMIGKAEGGTILVADAEGCPLVEITATEGQGMISIKQRTGALAAALTSDERGGALAVFDDEGRPRHRLVEMLSSIGDRITGKSREARDE